MSIIFVGDKPAKNNKGSNKAFIGTRSYTKLMSWIGRMQIDYRYIYMINKDKAHSYVQARHLHKFVALGNAAARELTKLGINHYKLPHPNSAKNDKKLIDAELKKCNNWLGI